MVRIRPEQRRIARNSVEESTRIDLMSALGTVPQRLSAVAFPWFDSARSSTQAARQTLRAGPRDGALERTAPLGTSPRLRLRVAGRRGYCYRQDALRWVGLFRARLWLDLFLCQSRPTPRGDSVLRPSSPSSSSFSGQAARALLAALVRAFAARSQRRVKTEESPARAHARSDDFHWDAIRFEQQSQVRGPLWV